MRKSKISSNKKKRVSYIGSKIGPSFPLHILNVLYETKSVSLSLHANNITSFDISLEDNENDALFSKIMNGMLSNLLDVDVSSNKLGTPPPCLDGISFLSIVPNLINLNLSANGLSFPSLKTHISSIEFKHLSSLNLSFNSITTLSFFTYSSFPSLKNLYLEDNFLPKSGVADLTNSLFPIRKNLQRLNLKGNAVCDSHLYKNRMICLLPSLMILDDATESISKEDRERSWLKLETQVLLQNDEESKSGSNNIHEQSSLSLPSKMLLNPIRSTTESNNTSRHHLVDTTCSRTRKEHNNAANETTNLNNFLAQESKNKKVRRIEQTNHISENIKYVYVRQKIFELETKVQTLTNELESAVQIKSEKALPTKQTGTKTSSSPKPQTRAKMFDVAIQVHQPILYSPLKPNINASCKDISTQHPLSSNDSEKNKQEKLKSDLYLINQKKLKAICHLHSFFVSRNRYLQRLKVMKKKFHYFIMWKQTARDQTHHTILKTRLKAKVQAHKVQLFEMQTSFIKEREKWKKNKKKLESKVAMGEKSKTIAETKLSESKLLFFHSQNLKKKMFIKKQEKTSNKIQELQNLLKIHEAEIVDIKKRNDFLEEKMRVGSIESKKKNNKVEREIPSLNENRLKIKELEMRCLNLKNEKDKEIENARNHTTEIWKSTLLRTKEEANVRLRECQRAFETAAERAAMDRANLEKKSIEESNDNIIFKAQENEIVKLRKVILSYQAKVHDAEHKAHTASKKINDQTQLLQTAQKEIDELNKENKIIIRKGKRAKGMCKLIKIQKKEQMQFNETIRLLQEQIRKKDCEWKFIVMDMYEKFEFTKRNMENERNDINIALCNERQQNENHIHNTFKERGQYVMRAKTLSLEITTLNSHIINLQKDQKEKDEKIKMLVAKIKQLNQILQSNEIKNTKSVSFYRKNYRPVKINLHNCQIEKEKLRNEKSKLEDDCRFLAKELKQEREAKEQAENRANENSLTIEKQQKKAFHIMQDMLNQMLKK